MSSPPLATRSSEARPLPFADGQIAATALIHDLTLVTANVKDFLKIEGLVIEDWSQSHKD